MNFKNETTHESNDTEPKPNGFRLYSDPSLEEGGTRRTQHERNNQFKQK